jgi:DNA recombination protein RmuC
MLYIFIAFLLLISLVLVGLVLSLKKKMESGNDDEKSRNIIEHLAAIREQNRALSDQNRELRQTMDSKLTETHRATQEQINHTMQTVQGITGQSAKQIADVVAGLTKLEETNKQVVNFSAQLQNLQDILKNPKQRGILGEYYLEEILRNVMPPNSYEMQYKIGKDESGRDLIVDAVVFAQKKIIPIDSKFSLENYEKIINCRVEAEKDVFEKAFKQDLKNRIDETAKYIRPEDGTMDFAFMFIPSEAIYYDLLVNKVGAVKVNTVDLIQYAIRDKKVIIVSPTSFHAYLQTVLQGLRALQIEEGAKQIRANVEKLGKHIVAFDDYMKKLGNNMATTVNSYNTACKELGKIDKDVVKITDGEKNIEPLIIDKPKSGED